MKNNNEPVVLWKQWSDGTFTVNILFANRRDVHVGTRKYLVKLLREKYKISA